MQPTQPSGDAALAEASLDDAPATPDAPRADTASALPTNTDAALADAALADAALADAALADARAGEAGWPTTKGVTCAEVDGEARCCRHDGTTHENRCCFVAASQRCDPCTYEGPRACVPDPSGSP